jgi:hypothetical protein
MRIGAKTFTCLAMAFLTSCGGGSDTETVDSEDVSMTFFRSFAAGTYVFLTQDELSTAWNAAPFESYPIGLVTTEPALPQYDFTKQSVIGISAGIGKWCFKPRITYVSKDDQDVTVHYEIPKTSTLACLRDGPLIAFALVPKLSGSLTFTLEQ